jgi:hypothetical protein
MKDLKHIKRFNESEENLNISDVRSSKLSNGFYWMKLRNIGIEEKKKSKWSLHLLNFVPKDGDWMIGYILNDSILIDGNPYPFDFFDIDHKIER